VPVFISHRTADDQLAQTVANRLRFHGINVWIDDFDKEAQSYKGGQKNITKLIVDRLNSCTNLLAIVTKNTEGSWWVPFEIGVARQAPRVITTFTDQSSLPEYLTEWPILRGQNAIDEFADIYKNKRYYLNESVLRKSEPPSGQFSRVEDFHRSLKIRLGQR